ncbi:hypothetical protein [Paracoccus tegillarcae]|uniref:Uncharacterized protein n=1 Tax=Paracoccus tegillarcae TaxID=1529068 RepID=A0A2K9EQI2_9RHOB|nr:hypothetical protein [Paracoccus tegillarcae]AUH35737.1 hypothetical protein CUV01_19330 [Paracoccus tegillarcae]
MMALPMEGRLILETADGAEIELAAGEGQRVLYALVTLAQTPVAPHITVAAVRTPQGVELWRGTSAGAAQ